MRLESDRKNCEKQDHVSNEKRGDWNEGDDATVHST